MGRLERKPEGMANPREAVDGRSAQRIFAP
jgi:hypothetical protein